MGALKRFGYSRLRVAAVAGLGVLAAGLGASAGAHGATVLGAPEFQNPGNGGFGSGNVTLIQSKSVASDQTDGHVYSAPFAGVITSWGKFASFDPNNLQRLRLKIGRPTSEGYKIVGHSRLETLTKVGAKNTFATRISVKAGDTVGLYAQNSGPVLFEIDFDFPYSHEITWAGGDAALGSLVSQGPFGSDILVVYATLEHDADRDGYGDESQDKCKGKAGPRNGCPKARKKGCKKGKGRSAVAAGKKCRKKR